MRTFGIVTGGGGGQPPSNSQTLSNSQLPNNNRTSSKNQPVANLKNYFKSYFKHQSDPNTSHLKQIAALLILNSLFLIFIFTPFAVYSSDITQFDPSQTYKTLAGLFGCFIFYSLAFIYAISFFSRARLFRLLVFGISTAFIIGFIYTFLLDFNVMTGEAYSQIDNFNFKNPHNINAKGSKVVDVAVGLFACALSLLLLRFENFYKNALKIMLFSFVAVGIFYFFKIVESRADFIKASSAHATITNAENLESLLPDFHNELFTFAPKNVLVMLFDGFTGSHLAHIFEQFPKLKDEFSGFTYYPNTLSVDGSTGLTAHTILTGFDTAPIANKDKSMDAYTDSINTALKQTFSTLSAKNYNVKSYGMPHTMESDSAKDVRIYHAADAYLPYFTAKHGLDSEIEKLRAKNVPIGEMASIGLFYFAPYTLRTRIYKMFEFGEYTWLFGKKKQIGSFINGIRLASQLPSMVENLRFDPTQKPSFKYIHTMATHYPFVLDSKNCAPDFEAQSVLPTEFHKAVPNKRHYDNEFCAIKEAAKLIRFFKDNGIFESSMIIFVSDHSYNDIIEHGGKSVGNNPNPLLLIKDFGSDSSGVRVDTRLMSNADVYGILCDKLEICELKDVREDYPKKRELTNTMNVHWTMESKNAKHLIFDRAWKVRGDLLDAKNWTEIRP